MSIDIRALNRRVRLARVVCGWAVALGLGSPVAAQFPEFGSDALETPVTSIEPRRRRSEQDLDQLHAAALYAHGRLLLQRDDPARALRRFERAYRYDPRGSHTIQEIVTLAGRTKRFAEATRYAILAAERMSGDPRLLRQLGEVLAGQGELDRAAAMYARVLALVNNAPIEDAPGKDAPAKDAPTKDAPIREAPIKDAQAAASVLLRAELGRLYLLTEKFDQAAAMLSVLRDALERPEEFGFFGEAKTKLATEEPRLYPLIAESFLRAGRFDDAAAMFRRAYLDPAQEPELAFQLARIAIEQRDWQDAREQLQRYFGTRSVVAGSQPYDLLERLIAGERAADKDMDKDAKPSAELLSTLSRLQEQDPQNTSLGYFFARKLAENGDSERAARMYSELLAREPSTDGYQALARLYQQQGNAEGLIRLLGQMVERESSRGGLDAVATAIAQDGATLERLVSTLRAASRAGAGEQPGYGGYVGLALAGIQAHKPDLAAELYEQALARPQAPQGALSEIVGLRALAGEEPALAAKIFQRAIEAGLPVEKQAPYHFYLSGAQELAGETSAALKAAEKCASLSPDSPQFQARPAWVLYHAKRWSEAEQRYVAVINHFDTHFHTDEVRDQVRQMRMILSNICVMLDRLPEAEEWLEQVLDEFPEDVGACNDLGYLWVDQNKHLNRALMMCERAVKSEPENGAYRDSLGWAYFRHGRFAESIAELEKAAQLTPDGIIFDHLGDAFLGANQIDKAVAAWRRGLEFFQKSSELEKSQQTAAKIERYQK